jgi:MFS family permease
MPRPTPSSSLCSAAMADRADAARDLAGPARENADAASDNPGAGADPAGDEPAARLITPAFVAVAAATLAFFISAGIVLPVAPRFAEQSLGADQLGIGVAIASFSIAALILRPIVGWSSDRFGRRPLLIGGSLLAVAALALHLVAASLSVFIVARALLGAGEGFFFVAALAAASDIAPVARRGEALSFLSLSLYLGLAVGPLIGEALLGVGSYFAVWLAAGVVAGIAVVLAWLTPETMPRVDRKRPSGDRAPLIHPAGLFPGLVILLGLWGMAGFLTFLPLYAREVGLEGAALPLAAYALVVIGLRILGARLPDQIGAARLSGAALACSAVGLAMIGLLPNIAALLIGTVIFAIGVAFTMPALLALAVSRVPDGERGTVVGTAALFLDLAFGIAPVVLGLIAARTGYGPTFIFSAVLAALASGLLIVRRRALAAPLTIATR